MSTIKMRPDVACDLGAYAELYASACVVPRSEVACALMLAAVGMLSSGMDDEQVRAVFDQVFKMTAAARVERNNRPKEGRN